ncbi:MAG: hypothetical protein OEZ32_00580 [Nitrospinota bacterium]|nr:hypothetical protein [Nitrospinota bacterium]
MSLIIRLSMGWGVGTGLLSILFFFWMTIFQSSSLLPMVEAAVTLALGIFYFRSRGKWAPLPGAHSPATQESRAITLFAGVVSLFLLASAVYVFLVNLAILPHGRWDAWMIWSLRAKALSYFHDDWRMAFDPSYGWTHAGYPLLLPASMARVAIHYNLSGCLPMKVFEPIIPAITSFLFTFSVPALVFSFIFHLRGAALALAASAMLLSAQMICLQGSSLYADLPLAFYMLAAVGLAAIAMEGKKENGRTWALAGFCAGLAAWTKNEGMLFVLALIWAVVCASWLKGGFRRALPRLGMLALGLAPPVFTIIAFKIAIPAHNYLISANTVEMILAKALDPDRYLFILFGMVYEIFHYGGVIFAGYTLPAPALALMFLAAWGTRERALRQEPVMMIMLSLTAMLIGYTAVYIITPMGLQYQFTTSVARLITQVWPIFVMLVTLAARHGDGEGSAAAFTELADNGGEDG